MCVALFLPPEFCSPSVEVLISIPVLGLDFLEDLLPVRKKGGPLGLFSKFPFTPPKVKWLSFKGTEL